MADAPASTAEAQLGRILYILAAARQPGGVSVEDVAVRLGVSPETVRDDVYAVTDREFYHPAASIMALSLAFEGDDRITVPLPGKYFDRPMRLTPREAGALGLALRARAAEAASPYREELLDLAVALELELSAPPLEALDNPAAVRVGISAGRWSRGAGAGGRGSGGGSEGGRESGRESGRKEPQRPSLARWVEVDPGAGANAGVKLLLQQAMARHTPVRLRYLKPGEPAPSERILYPYTLLTAEGLWYALGFCPGSGGMREFRLDRILSVEAMPGTYEVPADFDAAAYTSGGRPYRAEHEVECVVRYSARVAPWVLEHAAGGRPSREANGSVVVRLGVADPRWLVREVLRYGGEAEVLEPEEMRAKVREAAERIAAAAA